MIYSSTTIGRQTDTLMSAGNAASPPDLHVIERGCSSTLRRLKWARGGETREPWNETHTPLFMKHQCQSGVWRAVLVPISPFVVPSWPGVQGCHLQAEGLNSLFPWQQHACMWGAPVAPGNSLLAGIGVLSAAVSHGMSRRFAQGKCTQKDRNKSINRQVTWMGSAGDARRDTARRKQTHTGHP